MVYIGVRISFLGKWVNKQFFGSSSKTLYRKRNTSKKVITYFRIFFVYFIHKITQVMGTWTGFFLNRPHRCGHPSMLRAKFVTLIQSNLLMLKLRKFNFRNVKVLGNSKTVLSAHNTEIILLNKKLFLCFNLVPVDLEGNNG